MTNSLEKYAEVFKNLGLSELSVEDDGVKLTFKRDFTAGYCSSSFDKDYVLSDNKTGYMKAGSDNNTEKIPSGEKDLEKKGTLIKSPLLGVFYADVEGRKREVGDVVKKGDVLCSIEAMKMMNEVKSSADGIISKIGAKEGDLVEYDQLLFVIS